MKKAPAPSDPEQQVEEMVDPVKKRVARVLAQHLFDDLLRERNREEARKWRS